MLHTRRTNLLFGICLVCGGIALTIIQPSPPNLLIMCSMLLQAWNLAFTPSPSSRTPLGEIYRQSLAGAYRTSMTSKLVTLASILLLVAGMYGNIMQ